MTYDEAETEARRLNLELGELGERDAYYTVVSGRDGWRVKLRKQRPGWVKRFIRVLRRARSVGTLRRAMPWTEVVFVVVVLVVAAAAFSLASPTRRRDDPSDPRHRGSGDGGAL